MKVNKQFIFFEICSKEWVIFYHCNTVDPLLINKVKIERKQIWKQNFNPLQRKSIPVIVLNLLQVLNGILIIHLLMFINKLINNNKFNI